VILNENEEQIEKALSNLQNFISKYGTHFPLNYVQYLADYYHDGLKKIEGGLFKDEAFNKNDTWNVHNFRYGANSIEGTINEFFAYLVWNEAGDRTRLELEFDPQKQMKGLDCWFINDGWSRKYGGQIKTLNIVGGDKIILRRRYFEKRTDRLVLSSHLLEKVIIVDFDDTKRYINNNDHIAISETILLKDRRAMRITYDKEKWMHI
jgi:hypothetical protein